MSVSLRTVSERDLATLDRWASGVADNMSRTRPILDGADHHDPESGLFWFVIAEDGRDVGTVWIELLPAASEAVLGIFLGHAEDLGRGIGSAAIELAAAEFRRALPRTPIVLRVRRSNARAIACYRRAGFAVTGQSSKTLPSGEVVPFYRMACPAGALDTGGVVVDDIARLLEDKSMKAKEIVEAIAERLLGGDVDMEGFVELAERQKAARRSNLVEALELATKSRPSLVDRECLDFLTAALLDKAPRTKWEAARVIANCCGQFSGELEPAVENLQLNVSGGGTVVRWSVAFALSEIATRSAYPHKEQLLARMRENEAHEEKDSIKKIYRQALAEASSG